jgi:hypothetical protein
MDASRIQMDGVCSLCGTDWKCSTNCDLIVNSTVHVLRHETYSYVLACLDVFIDIVQQV